MDEIELKNIRQELTKIRQMMTDVTQYMRSAESEVPEEMRRFTMYMVDIHTIVHLYEERGLTAPDYVLREMERCDDRLRQLLNKHHTDGGAFEKVRREMAKDTDNRWDHTRTLTGPRGAVS